MAAAATIINPFWDSSNTVIGGYCTFAKSSVGIVVKANC